MWKWMTSTWAKLNFGQYAQTFIRLMEIVSSVLAFAMPIVEMLEGIKSRWSDDFSSNRDMLVDIVKEQSPGEENPNIVVMKFYDSRHIGETLFGLAVWLLKQKVPDSAPYAKLAVELAYLLLTLRNKLK